MYMLIELKINTKPNMLSVTSVIALKCLLLPDNILNSKMIDWLQNKHTLHV